MTETNGALMAVILLGYGRAGKKGETAVLPETRCAGNLIATAQMARIDGHSFSGLEHRDNQLGEKGDGYTIGENGRFPLPHFPHTLSPECLLLFWGMNGE